MHMDKELIEDKLDQIMDQFNEINITTTEFFKAPINNLHVFYEGNGRTCEIMFANDDIIRQNL